MPAPERVVVIGGGLAGAKTAEALRTRGFTGEVTLVAAENRLPYERPPLSKEYLLGRSTAEEATVHPPEWYREHDVTLRLGTRATRLDPAAHAVHLDDGTTLPYDRAVLATGSRPRRLSRVSRVTVASADARGVHRLRTIEDADALRAAFGAGRRLAIVGGGWIGLEAAAAARAVGTEVTVIEHQSIPLERVLGERIARVFADLHRAHGVELRTGARVGGIETGTEGARGVRLEDGQLIAADAVLVGIGATPRTELAEAAGLAVDNGVLVDATLRTSDPDVYAVGDIAHQAHPLLGERVRVEHWATALNQPATAAASLLGERTEYTELPYFYTDQYDVGMEYLGYAPPGSYERVLIRGSLEAREFVAFWVSAGNRVRAVMTVNTWDVVDRLKPLLVAGGPVDPDRLTDPRVPFEDL